MSSITPHERSEEGVDSNALFAVILGEKVEPWNEAMAYGHKSGTWSIQASFEAEIGTSEIELRVNGYGDTPKDSIEDAKDQEMALLAHLRDKFFSANSLDMTPPDSISQKP